MDWLDLPPGAQWLLTGLFGLAGWLLGHRLEKQDVATRAAEAMGKLYQQQLDDLAADCKSSRQEAREARAEAHQAWERAEEVHEQHEECLAELREVRRALADVRARQDERGGGP